MVAPYTKPIQARAAETERRFLLALETLLAERSFAQLSVEDIAVQARLTRSAFLKRFGSKQQALLVLFQRYCDDCAATLDDLGRQLPVAPGAASAAAAAGAGGAAGGGHGLEAFCARVSARLEALIVRHFPANRAMHELFMEDLQVAQPTKTVFRQTVGFMRAVQHSHLGSVPRSEWSAYAAAQLLVTLNYNHVLRAMPAFPVEPEVRHRLIGVLLATTLRH